MPLSSGSEAIRRRILEDAKSQAEAILSEASSKAGELVGVARENAEKTRRARIEEREALVKEKMERQMAEANVEYHRRLEKKRTEAIDGVFEEAAAQLNAFTAEKGYSAFLFRLIVESGVKLGGGELLLQVNRRDRDSIQAATLRKAANAIEERVKQKTTLEPSDDAGNFSGGVIASKMGGGIFVNNTLEERLKSVRQELTKEVEAMLHGE
ncbi:MAG: V-type proton ATPase subunit E [Aigarchaeota archaeon]|nr:V-type proton ATPase subunit E [Aigarchaeota archaeon]MDH5703630.1 V-type proton ATPase subunit E [Aigarchaeota archaeon]